MISHHHGARDRYAPNCGIPLKPVPPAGLGVSAELTNRTKKSRSDKCLCEYKSVKSNGLVDLHTFQGEGWELVHILHDEGSICSEGFPSPVRWQRRHADCSSCGMTIVFERFRAHLFTNSTTLELRKRIAKGYRECDLVFSSLV
ncbi:hypothetical protein EON65_55945 [archaeon]|nr:MAG: hypothetical protein EON65_55945 [archaeon]